MSYLLTSSVPRDTHHDQVNILKFFHFGTVRNNAATKPPQTCQPENEYPKCTAKLEGLLHFQTALINLNTNLFNKLQKYDRKQEKVQETETNSIFHMSSHLIFITTRKGDLKLSQF